MSNDLSKKTQSILKTLGHEISLTSSSVLIEKLSSDLAKEESLCPRCKVKSLPSSAYAAISRKDNKTKICEDCGLDEAGGDLKLMSTVQGKAEIMLKYFELKTRSNGNEFYCLKHGHPEWIRDVCRECHGDMMPDDYKYQFIHEALLEICEAKDLEDIQLEADIYTADLLKWLSSNLTRTTYMDEAAKEFGPFDQFENHLMAAQQLEKQEVLNQLLESLKGRLDTESDLNDDENNKTFAKKVVTLLKEQGHKISLGHAYEFISKLAGYGSWNEASAKGVSLRVLIQDKIHPSTR
jgi:hypothetical protein